MITDHLIRFICFRFNEHALVSLIVKYFWEYTGKEKSRDRFIITTCKSFRFQVVNYKR